MGISQKISIFLVVSFIIMTFSVYSVLSENKKIAISGTTNYMSVDEDYKATRARAHFVKNVNQKEVLL